MLTNDNFTLLSSSLRSSGFSDELIEGIRQNFVQVNEGSVSSGDMFAQTLGANTQFFSQITNAMAVIASGEDKPVEIGGLTIEDINSLTGMTVFTTQLNLVQAQMELINNMFNFVKQFEKSLTSVASG